MKPLSKTATIAVIVTAALGSGSPAWALQSHSAPEGIYVHQMAHVLFLAALVYLSWHIRRSQNLNNKGWKYLHIFCVLMVLWNVLAFSGHEALEHLTENDLVDKDTWKEQLVAPITFAKGLYYVTKMDHFLMVPALFALVASLRSFYREALGRVRR